MLPKFFTPILWSFDPSRLDLRRHRATIVTAAVNYGDLTHWRWLLKQYGRSELRRTIEDLPESALRPQAARLAQLMFGIKRFPYASRRTHA